MTAKATSRDVARLARVSQATVSYVLNNTEGKHISDATRKAVLEAARQLGYVPNSAARRLKTRRSNCVAVRLATVMTIQRYFMALQGLRSYFESRGYNLILFNDMKEGNAGNYLEACLDTQADGVIYFSADYSGIPEEELEILRKNRIPVSAIDCMGAAPDVSSVTYDYYASTALRVQYLAQRGIKRLIYLEPSVHNVKDRERTRGFLVPAEELGLEGTVEEYPTDATANESRISGTSLSMGTFFDFHAKEFFRDLIRRAPGDAAILAPYPEVQDVVAQLLYEDALTGKAGGKLPWYERGASYRFSHYDVGVEAARSLYGAIKGNGGVRKLSVQPQVIPYTAEMI